MLFHVLWRASSALCDTKALPHINLLTLRYRLLFNAAEIKASYLLINGTLLGYCITANTEGTSLRHRDLRHLQTRLPFDSCLKCPS